MTRSDIIPFAVLEEWMLGWNTITKECNSSAAHRWEINFHEYITSHHTLGLVDNWERDTQPDFCSLNERVKLTVLELSALCEWVITLAVDIIDHARRCFLPHRSIGGFLTWVYSLSQRKKIQA